jgi:lipopolysaccharide transport system permease protein
MKRTEKISFLQIVRTRADLIWALSWRDLMQKYRGSLLGFCWTFITPLALLGIYTVVFGTIMKMSWGPEDTGLGGFAIMLFCGLIPFNFFNDVMIRSSQVVVASPNYVKRISFPTEILPLVVNISSGVHMLISVLILVCAQLVLMGHIAWTIVFLPLVWLPLLISALACSFIAAAVGVFLRDLPHLLGIAFSALFFLTPIIYPAERVPESLHVLLYINPIAYAATNMRQIMVFEIMPNWTTLLSFTGVSLIGLYVSFRYFEQVKRRFADVL